MIRCPCCNNLWHISQFTGDARLPEPLCPKCYKLLLDVMAAVRADAEVAANDKPKTQGD